MNSPPLIDVSNPIWYPERSDSRRSLITSSASLHTMTSMLSLFKYITHSSSIFLEEIKLIAIVNWIFHGSGSRRSFIKSFKYGLVLLTDFYSVTITFIFDVIWLVITFLLKESLNISNYSIFYCFILFFSLKQFLMFLIILSSSDCFCTFNLLGLYCLPYTF